MEADRYLVTGGLGFIGSEFVRRARASDADVTIVDVGTYAGDERRLEGVGGYHLQATDVADERIADIVSEVAPDVIIHMAAESHVTRSENAADAFFRTNVEGTQRVLEAAVAADTELVIHVSTDEVYGSCDSAPFREDDKQPGEGRATSAYARSKAVADDLAVSFMHRVPLIVVRPTNCFGPWQHPEKAIARWAIRAVSGERIPVWGDGGYVRDWMGVADACSAIELLIQSGEPSSVFNIAPEDSQRTNIEVARKIAAAAGRDADAVYLTAYDRPGHDRRYAIDASKLRGLGWTPSSTFESAIEDTVGWYAEHRDWWSPLVADSERLYEDTAQWSGTP